MACKQLDAPIVLAHGLFGYDRIGFGRVTVSSYFRGIPELLRAGGNRVVVTRVPPIAGVKRRARALGVQIERACPGEAVHLIGHSMGGLDARQLMADPAWSGRVLSLTTVGTPHLGSALADCARARVGPVYRLLRTMRIEHRAFHDLTRRAARAVHRHGFVPHRVPCFCVAGEPSPEDVCWPLKPFYDVLADLEGPNDGLVSVASAVGYGTPLPSWPVDHLRQLKWLAPAVGPSSGSAIGALYVSLVENLAAHGFASDDPDGAAGTGVTTPPPSLKKKRRVFLLDPILDALRTCRAVKQDGDGHVAEDVGRGPAAVEEPVDGH